MLKPSSGPEFIRQVFLVLAFAMELTRSRAHFEGQFPRFQKNYWYEYSTPKSTSVPEYIDYHLSPESSPPSASAASGPRILNTPSPENVTAQLGASATLHCVIENLQDKTVSWVRRVGGGEPVLLTFGESVYVNDLRISVSRGRGRGGAYRKDEWVLNVLNARQADEATYECQVATEPPIIHKIHLFVEAPVLTVMDGFGRELLDQYYKVGSSLEVMCHVDRLPARPLPNIVEWSRGEKTISPNSNASAATGLSIRTELEGFGAVSHLSIAQATVGHSGVYTCAVSDNISQALRLHIIDESKPVPIINAGSSLASEDGLQRLLSLGLGLGLGLGGLLAIQRLATT